METFTKVKDFSSNPDFPEQRQKTLKGLDICTIDRSIVLCNILRYNLRKILRRILMITLTKDEIISSSKASKNFGQLLNRLKSGEAEKIVISKNNELEAVIITFKEFEEMQEAFELLEHLEISRIIETREDEKTIIGLDELISESNLSRKDLEESEDL